jgi:hypothetical protein
VINLPDDDPEAVTAMVSYFYGQDYEGVLNDRYCRSDSDLPLHACIYSVAHKYDIPGLENSAKESFKTWAELNWDSQDFPGIVREVWSSEGYKGLYDVISKIIAEQVNQFLDSDNGELINTGLSLGKLSAEFVRDAVQATKARTLDLERCCGCETCRDHRGIISDWTVSGPGT